MNSAADPSPFDPLLRMPPDEPRFVLRGKDPATPASITEWARITRNKAISLYGENPTRKRDREALEAIKLKCAEAEKVAFAIDDWRKQNSPVEGARANYNDVEHTAEALALLETKRVIDRQIRNIQEARYQLSEARDALQKLGKISDEQAAEMTRWLDEAQAISELIDPTREFHEPSLPLPEGEGA